jgi:hypothetical protein
MQVGIFKVCYTDPPLFINPRDQENAPMITGRDLCKEEALESGYLKYTKEISDLAVEESQQVVEVGAGLGEFIPSVAIRYPHIPKPILIDPADYEAIREILLYSKKTHQGIFNRGNKFDIGSIINSWLDRIEIILDPNKVRLINTTLDEALRTDPLLRGSADILVDFKAIRTYYRNCEQQQKYLKSLLKENGKLLPPDEVAEGSAWFYK